MQEGTGVGGWGGEDEEAGGSVTKVLNTNKTVRRSGEGKDEEAGE